MVYTKVPKHSDINNKKTGKKNGLGDYFSILYNDKRILSQNNKKMNPMLPKLRVEGSSPFSRSMIIN
jgi:hypothetical protein